MPLLAGLIMVLSITTLSCSKKIQQEQEALSRLYKTMVIKEILSNTVYPSYAMKKRYQGKILLEITISRQGEVMDVSVLEKSRFKMLNESAIKAVERVDAFPAFPPALNGDTISVQVPVKLSLR